MVTVRTSNGKKSYKYFGQESLLLFLNKHGEHIPADCGGNGICGKCKIRLLSGELEITKSDEQFFSKKELEKGFRLSCMAFPKQDIEIEFERREDDIQALSINGEIADKNLNEEGSFSIAIDIGTTTLAMALVSKEERKVLDQYTGTNHQRSYGADVVSRIKSSNEGHNIELQKLVKEDLFAGICKLSNDFNRRIEQIIISGNTTMIHLLMNYDCKQLGSFPYQSDHLAGIHTSAKELFHIEEEISIYLMPGISAFVGGDIVSGLYDLNIMERKETTMLVDLGTNGELLVGNRDGISCTSTAIGPAFEGGKISAGIPSIAGAICKVWKNQKTEEIEFETILNKEAIGICGSGIIDVIALLLDEELMDETGLLEDPYFDEGYLIHKDEHNDIRIIQKDIREIQLAKAAVLAGIKTLIEMNEKEEISEIYLAGGFGHGINLDSAIKIDLLPNDYEIKVVGNTSLQGAIKLLLLDEKRQKEEINRIEKFVLGANTIDLSKQKDFQDKYIGYMHF